MADVDVHTLERERVRKKLASNLFGAEAVPLHVGRFTIEQHLGRGAFCIVYAAFDPELQRHVAIKLLSRGVDATQALAEARALAGLTHPNVLTVFETGLHEGVAFIVTELVHGGDLRAWAASLPEGERAARLVPAVVAVGRGLEAAHQRGLVHRDVKPENVLVGSDDRPRVADFGLAASAVDGKTTPAGTPRYMAPEQARGGLPDPRSDQYSFSLMALELAGALLDQRQTQALRRGSSPNPDARHPSMGALLAALEAHGEPTPRPSRWGARVSVAALAVAGVIAAFALASRRDAAARPAFRGIDVGVGRTAPRGDTTQDVDRAARAASEMLQRGDARGCVARLADDHGSSLLSALRIECARRTSPTELRSACGTHEARYGEVADGCASADLDARERLARGDFEGCVRGLDQLAWTAQRSLLLSECVNRWDDLEGRLRLCEFMRRHTPPEPGAPACGGSETLEAVIAKKKGGAR